MATPDRDSSEPALRTRGGRIDSNAPPREAGGRDGQRLAAASEEAPARPRRNYGLAIAIALIVFALLIGVRVLWDGLGSRAPSLPPAGTAQEAPAPAN